jgi:hypothetical protein
VATVDVQDTDRDGIQMDREREDRPDTACQCRCGEAWPPEAGTGVGKVGDRHRLTGGDGVQAGSLTQDDLQVFEPVALRAAVAEDDPPRVRDEDGQVHAVHVRYVAVAGRPQDRQVVQGGAWSVFSRAHLGVGRGWPGRSAAPFLRTGIAPRPAPR